MPVELFEIAPGAPLVFHCYQLRANLSPRACARSYSASFNLACAHCSKGAEHAVATPPPAQKLVYVPHHVEPGLMNHNRDAHGYVQRFQRVAAKTCIRCNAQVMRRIEPGLCISCVNRHAEVLHGRNAKGTFPSAAAKRLYRCHALLSGTFPHLFDIFRVASQCAPTLQRISGGAFISGVFSGRAEFDQWLAEHHPDAQLLDFEQGRSLAELASHAAPAPAPKDQMAKERTRSASDQNF